MPQAESIQSFRERVASRAANARRRRSVVLGAVVVPVLAVAGSLVYLRSQAGELTRVDVGGLTPVTAAAPPSATSGGPPASAAPREPVAPPIAAPLNLLVVGVDTRATGEDGAGEVTGTRADTVAVVRIDPVGGRIAVISLPRDLWVDLDGRAGRINSFLTDGDPTALVGAVTATLGVEIHHFVQIDFAGFRRVVDLAGGLDVPFDAALRDRHTGFQVDPGCQHLDGDRALAYARSRHLERFDEPTQTWVTDPTSDLGRVTRQQDLMARLVATVVLGDYSATDEVRILTDVLDDLTVDRGITVTTLRSLFATAREIGPDRLTTHSVNDALSPATVDGQSVLLADPARVAEVVQAFHGAAAEVTAPVTEAPAPTPSSVSAPAPDGAIRPAPDSC